MTLFFRGSNSKKVLKHGKKFGIETLFPQPIFVVFGRELLPKFSIMTEIFSNYFDGLPAFAPSALVLHGFPAFALLALAFKILIEYRERVLFWMTVTRGHGAMVDGPGRPYFLRFEKRKEYAPSALAFKI